MMVTIPMLLLSSCAKDDGGKGASSSLTPRSGGSDPADYVVLADSLAKELSCLASSKPQTLTLFRDLAQASEAAGHYDSEFFWNLEKDVKRSVYGDLSLSEMLILQNPANADLLDEICTFFPAMSVLQIGPDVTGLATPTQISPKIYFDNLFDDMDTTATVPYYENCVKYSTSVANEPTQISFIVRECESYVGSVGISDGAQVAAQNDTYVHGRVCGNDILLLTNPTLGPDPNDPGPPAGCTQPCERDCIPGTDMISRLRARNDYDAWKGKGEFRFHFVWAEDVKIEIVDGDPVLSGNPLKHTVKAVNGVKGNNQFTHPRSNILPWDINRDGDIMKCYLFEHDGGLIKKIPIEIEYKYGGLTLKSKIDISTGHEDDFIGDDIIWWCHPIDPDGFWYTPSTEVDYFLGRRQF